MPPFEALKLAKSKNLHLVEISPTAQPPVCRIMDYGKYLYQQAKKEHERPRRKRSRNGSWRRRKTKTKKKRNRSSQPQPRSSRFQLLLRTPKFPLRTLVPFVVEIF